MLDVYTVSLFGHGRLSDPDHTEKLSNGRSESL